MPHRPRRIGCISAGEGLRIKECTYIDTISGSLRLPGRKEGTASSAGPATPRDVKAHWGWVVDLPACLGAAAVDRAGGRASARGRTARPSGGRPGSGPGSYFAYRLIDNVLWCSGGGAQVAGRPAHRLMGGIRLTGRRRGRKNPREPEGGAAQGDHEESRRRPM